MRTPPLRSWVRRRRGYAWGFVDQAISSATNFALFLLAGRQLGPDGLGVVTIAISAYLLTLGFQRSLVTTPLVSSSAPLQAAARSLAIRRGLTLVLAASLTAALLLIPLGLIVGGDAGRGFLILVPWLAPALLQDFWRAILFQEQRASAAAANDAAWGVLMLVTAPFAWFLGTEWAIVGCWGVGALAGALLGFVQTRALPASVREAFGWWWTRLWPFARWLGLQGVIYAVATSATVFVLYGVIGSAAVGGLRAAESVFAPLSLIVPALALPGLPAMTRALSASPASAMRLAVRLSAVAGALAGLYGVAMVALGGQLIPFVFGSSFDAFENLAWPIGSWQLVLALGVGFGIFLTAQERGRDLLVARSSGVLATLLGASALAWLGGVVGAAWGYALGGAAATVLMLAFATRSYRRPASADRTPSAQPEVADA